MAWIFGDGFDCYAAVADATAGYWDSGSVSGFLLVAGRFAGSQAAQLTGAPQVNFVKSSAVNDAVHHIVVAYRQTATLTGTTLGNYFQFVDVATNQCCIVFRSDGAILLTSATPGGTVLATYTGAVTATNTWFAFEFEVVINNTTGSFTVRKNGNPANDFTATSLNTRPGTNSYANKLQVGNNAAINNCQIDDLLWRSDAASVPWMGDIRCYTRMPASDASVQFSRAPSPSLVTPIAATSTSSDPTGTSRYTAFTASFSGTIGTVAAGFNPGFTGNCKMALFADNAGVPGAVLGSATILVNPVSGNNNFTFGTPVSVVKGTQYWFGVSHDVTAVLSVSASTFPQGRNSSTVSYASFPTANPAVGGASTMQGGTITITPTLNAEFVNETLQDGTTSYVYDSTIGHADFYNIQALAGTPASVVAVTTRGFIEKSDAGFRSGAVQLKSGGATVASATANLSTSWGWVWRVDQTDPNTSAAWTPVGVNGVTIGPVVIG